jgi:hypothetical protein
MRVITGPSCVKSGLCVLMVVCVSQAVPIGRPNDSSDVSLDESWVDTPPRVPSELWSRMDRSTDRALEWLARQQRPDGSFPTYETGQPGVTALCAMAFLSRGKTPDDDRYGQVITKAVDYVLSCQHPDGLIAKEAPQGPMSSKNSTHTAAYNHAIGGLLLSEVYGMTRGQAHERIHKAIDSAIGFTKKRLPAPKQQARDKGGWRYASSKGRGHDDSDLSVTSWHLMFLRSSRNAGFDVPSQMIDEALAYVRRCFDPQEGTFLYGLASDRKATRSMAGAGILSLSLGGQHRTEQATKAAEWVLAHPFVEYHSTVGWGDRFFYGVFYCSQAMFQMGGTYWDGFYPTTLRLLINYQRSDGSWDEEFYGDEPFGRTYSTAMAVLAITPPYQMLPIFQR